MAASSPLADHNLPTPPRGFAPWGPAVCPQMLGARIPGRYLWPGRALMEAVACCPTR